MQYLLCTRVIGKSGGPFLFGRTMDFEEARLLMETHARNVRGNNRKDRKKLKNKTYLELNRINKDVDDSYCYSLRYFNTEILTFSPGCVGINDGGFFSHSTMERLNQYMPQGFRMNGWTFPALNLNRPLGFIATPKGAFPYSMPCAFSYDGEPEHKLCRNVTEVIPAIPAYVDRYLNQLLNGEPCSIEDEHLAYNAFTLKPGELQSKDIGAAIDSVSRQVGDSILAGRTYRHLVSVACLRSTKFLQGINFERIAQVLTKRGPTPFKLARTRGQQMQSFEDTLYFGQKIPTIKMPTLRRELRNMLMEHLVEQLGFATVQWNRRER